MAVDCGIARSSALACSVKVTRLAIPTWAIQGFVERRCGHGLPVVHREAKIAEDFVDRDGLMVLAPRVGFSDGLTVFFREGLII